MDEQTPALMTEHKPSDVFNNRYMQNLRKELKSGCKSESCKNCWDVEALGGESRRIRENRRFPEVVSGIRDGSLEPVQPKYLDVKFGNKCNLKCRICSPKSSSLWMKEHSDVYGEDGTGHFQTGLSRESMDEFFNKTVGWPENADHVWTDLKGWIDGVEEFELYGGEPFLNKDMYKLLEESIARGVAHKQVLHFNTNGTLYSKRLVEELFPKFKNVTLSLSLDGTFEQFEYQRHPAKWKIVFDNFNKFRAAGIETTICLSVSALNFYYLPEYLEFWRHHNVNVHLNEVTTPHYFDVRVFPQAVKEKVAEKFSRYDLEVFDAFTLGRVQTFLNQMNSMDQSHLWEECLHVVRKHDVYRKESYAQVFPEFYEITKGTETASLRTNTVSPRPQVNP